MNIGSRQNNDNVFAVVLTVARTMKVKIHHIFFVNGAISIFGFFREQDFPPPWVAIYLVTPLDNFSFSLSSCKFRGTQTSRVALFEILGLNKRTSRMGVTGTSTGLVCRGVGSGEQGGRLPPLFKVGGEHMYLPPPLFGTVNV